MSFSIISTLFSFLCTFSPGSPRGPWTPWAPNPSSPFKTVENDEPARFLMNEVKTWNFDGGISLAPSPLSDPADRALRPDRWVQANLRCPAAVCSACVCSLDRRAEWETKGGRNEKVNDAVCCSHEQCRYQPLGSALTSLPASPLSPFTPGFPWKPFFPKHNGSAVTWNRPRKHASSVTFFFIF